MNRRSDPAAAWPECIGQLKRTCRLAACETAGWQPALLRRRNWIVHHQRFEALFLRRSHLERLAVFLSAMLLSVFGARAHQPGMSTLAVQVRPEVVMVEITLSRVDAERLYPLDADKNGTVTPAEFDQAQAAMEELGITMVELSADGKLLPPDTHLSTWMKATRCMLTTNLRQAAAASCACGRRSCGSCHLAIGSI